MLERVFKDAQTDQALEPRDALAEAIDEYGLDGTRFSAEAWATLVMQFNKGLLLERLLGFDRGHAELLAAIDRWLTSLEEGKP